MSRKRAPRLLVMGSTVWFSRVGSMAWVFTLQGPVGFDPETFTGPFITFWVFAQYTLPLAFFELYFLAQESCAAPVKIVRTVLLSLATLLMAVGIVGAANVLWLPWM